MSSYFQQIINLLINPPGNLVYHLVLAFSLAAALAISLRFWQANGTPQGKRMVIGLGLLLILRLVLFVAAGLSWQGMINGSILLPPLDRFISLMGIILISWMWVFPSPSRAGDVATLLLGLISVTFFSLSLVWWYGQDTLSDFNGSWADTASAMLCLGITTASGLLLAMRRPVGWGFGLGMLTILLIGEVAYLTYPYPAGDYSGAVRLAQMIAYPLLLTLPLRFSDITGEKKQETSLASQEQEQVKSTSQGSYYPSLFKLITNPDPENIYLSVVKTVAQDWLADICMMVSAPGPHGKMEILGGYDLIRESTLGRSIINSQSIPVIASALRRGRALRLPASSTSPDMAGLGKLLDVKMVGNLLAAPVVNAKGEFIAGILLLTPYSRRTWSAEDQLRLTEFVLPLAQVLQHSDYSAKLIRELNQTQAALKTAQLEAERTRKENEQLLARFGIDPEGDGNQRLHAASLAALIAAQEEAQDTISKLQAEINRMQQADTGQAQVSPEIASEWLHREESQKIADQHAEAEIRLALEEVAYLKSLIYEADKKLLAMSNEQKSASPSDQQMRDISAVAQELRQPLSAIIGYTDFLLGESIGILGMLQRRFLERIRSSSDRMSKLVDHLIQITGEDEARIAVDVDSFQLSGLIDGAISKTSHAMQVKKIALRMDIPRQMPELRTDRNALEKILVALLENAHHLSSVNGEITLRVQLKGDEHAQDYVLIQIVHQGNELAFDQIISSQPAAQADASENVETIHQPQVGLSTLKTLTKSLGGRIWVDADPGANLTYSVLFPVSIAQNTGNNGAGGQL